jgi:hypothetical protein
MVEFNNRKVAVIELGTDNNILITSASAKCQIDKNNNVVTITDIEDSNYVGIPGGTTVWR